MASMTVPVGVTVDVKVGVFDKETLGVDVHTGGTCT